MGHLVYEARGQQRHIISLLERQIEAQETAAQEIRSAAVDTSTLVANELTHSADDLRSTVSHLSADVISTIRQATNDIGYDIDILGKRVCACLLLIGWIASQQYISIGKILETLLNSRNNEAKQLVKQGLRHLAVGEYSEAEERFVLALSYDSTDYQALLNLAFVKSQQGDSAAAHIYFRKSITLPENLNASSKERALWAWARLHRADGHYDNALETANQAMSLQLRPTGVALFTTSVYAGLKGDLALCISRLRDAITIDSTFFARAAVEPDLAAIRPHVLRLLSDLGSRAQAKARTSCEQANQSLARLLVDCKYVSSYDQVFVKALQGIIFEAKQSLASPSYTGCLLIVDKMRMVDEIIQHLRELELLHGESKKLLGDSRALSRNPPQRRKATTHEPLGFWGTITKIIGEAPVPDDTALWQDQWDEWMQDCKQKEGRTLECVRTLNKRRSLIREKLSAIGPLP